MAKRPPVDRDNTLAALRDTYERLTGLRAKHAADLRKAEALVEREQRAIARLDRQIAMREVVIANFGGDWSAWEASKTPGRRTPLRRGACSGLALKALKQADGQAMSTTDIARAVLHLGGFKSDPPHSVLMAVRNNVTTNLNKRRHEGYVTNDGGKPEVRWTLRSLSEKLKHDSE